MKNQLNQHKRSCNCKTCKRARARNSREDDRIVTEVEIISIEEENPIDLGSVPGEIGQEDNSINTTDLEWQEKKDEMLDQKKVNPNEIEELEIDKTDEISSIENDTHIDPTKTSNHSNWTSPTSEFLKLYSIYEDVKKED